MFVGARRAAPAFLTERLAVLWQAGLTSARSRRSLARWLRSTARDATTPRRVPNDMLLRYRAAAVRTELIELAALIERTEAPDPLPVAALRALLRDGASPLYNPAVPAAELHKTIEYIRSGLQPTSDETSPIRDSVPSTR
jgi:hypothetical protein